VPYNVVMGNIIQLSEDLIKKIAAGEVIERPASVVKEIVENSIDAGATRIEIEIERSGKYLKISDNGMGIDPGDLPLLFARHATSKIKRFDDLWRVGSLGFRGEALASISAVSKVICKSKHINQEYGFEAKFENETLSKKTSSVSIGTVFEIDDLFYNVPARQKFLKSGTTEIGHIQDIIISHAISRPKIIFKLLNNKSVVLKTNGSGNLQQTIPELLGNDLINKLIPISAKNNFVELSGYISALEIFRADKKSQFIFVNNRPIKCQIVSKAVLSAFEGLLPQGKYPVVVMNLNFRPTFVDVNVHPSKKEVRYTQPNDVYSLVLHSIQNAIAEYYKEKYKEQSVYALPEIVDKEIKSKEHKASYPKAAFEMYSSNDNGQENKEATKQEIKETAKQETKTSAIIENSDIEFNILEQKSQLFSVNNLKCQINYSDKPIANMTKIGNKTVFEVGSIFRDNVQVVFSGEITGEQDYQKSVFNTLSNLSNEIYKTFSQSQNPIQKKILSSSLEEERLSEKKTRKKPSEKLLYQVWDRDNWTCVYCAKQLLDPGTVRESIPHSKDSFITYLNSKGEKIINHILQEHSASYDHYLPFSKLPQFGFDLANLFACCMDCNRKKLDSMSLETWKPVVKSSWTKPLEIAGLCFNTPKQFSKNVGVVKII